MDTLLVLAVFPKSSREDKWYRLWSLVQDESDNNNESEAAIHKTTFIIVDYFNDVLAVQNHTHTMPTQRYTIVSSICIYILFKCTGQINIVKDRNALKELTISAVGKLWLRSLGTGQIYTGPIPYFKVDFLFLLIRLIQEIVASYHI